MATIKPAVHAEAMERVRFWLNTLYSNPGRDLSDDDVAELRSLVATLELDARDRDFGDDGRNMIRRLRALIPIGAKGTPNPEVIEIINKVRGGERGDA